MAFVEFEGDREELKDGGRVLDVLEDLGVPLGCQDGFCGTCTCTIVSGAENLGPLNEKEEDMDLADGERLACQCTIKSGTVVLSAD